ncbi:hypothetical protein C8R47DRAFT_1102513 [Mycena vitilis]|nr:hypothetical protein C8R47DRAFT_1102513 [Mycena vitilis]
MAILPENQSDSKCLWLDNDLRCFDFLHLHNCLREYGRLHLFPCHSLPVLHCGHANHNQKHTMKPVHEVHHHRAHILPGSALRGYTEAEMARKEVGEKDEGEQFSGNTLAGEGKELAEESKLGFSSGGGSRDGVGLRLGGAALEREGPRANGGLRASAAGTEAHQALARVIAERDEQADHGEEVNRSKCAPSDFASQVEGLRGKEEEEQAEKADSHARYHEVDFGGGKGHVG